MPSCSLSQFTLLTSFDCAIFAWKVTRKYRGSLVTLQYISPSSTALFGVYPVVPPAVLAFIHLSKERVAPPKQEVTFARVWAVLAPLAFTVFGIFVTLFVTSELIGYPLFWDTTQRGEVIPYRRFGTNCRSYLQASRSLVTLKDGTYRLPRNVGMELQL